ncbi:MAG: hypothetical protein NTV36_01890 [Candidatus Staskawiczbacteria bacterium]|nr:hypothetical protein [Candidatus Staskawiczbacteria bacterium]
MKKVIIVLIFVALVMVICVAVFFGYFFMGKTQVQDKITWGVDFSQMQAENLKLNWKETYSAMIDDLGVKNIKLHTQWDWVEGKKDNYYFGDIDWQIKQAEQKNVKIIYVLGMKTGRWPECHIPLWAQNVSEERQQAELLKYMTEVVIRYKNSKAIVNWQVENEPLFKFGECPAWYYKNDDFLKTEVNLVKSLDSTRKIIISDSGEQSTWFGAAKIGDIVGITMYRNVWAHLTDTFGFNVYSFLNPVTYSRKVEIIKKMFNKDVICVELQAEPWASKPFFNVSLEEQTLSMNPTMFKENVKFAKQTGLDKFYFWGVEWWYWMKEKQNQPEIWNEAKQLFN